MSNNLSPIGKVLLDELVGKTIVKYEYESGIAYPDGLCRDIFTLYFADDSHLIIYADKSASNDNLRLGWTK